MKHQEHNSVTPCSPSTLILASCCGLGCANCGACRCGGKDLNDAPTVEERIARLVALGFDIPTSTRPLTIN